MSEGGTVGRRLPASMALGSILATLCLLALMLRTHAMWPMDEGNLLLYPTLLFDGWVPHRDYETLYGPLNIWVLAGAYRAFGASIEVERSVGLAYRAAVVVAVFLLARRRGVSVGAASALIACSFTMLLELPAFAWFGGVAAGLFSVYLATSDDDRLFSAGVLAGLALLYRPDLILAIGGVTVAVHRWRFVRGSLLGLAPWIVQFILVGPVLEFRKVFLDPMAHSAARRLPLPVTSQLFLLVVGSVVLAVVVGMTTLRRDGTPALATIAVFEVGLLPQAFQRADTAHLLFVGSVTVALAPLFAASIPGTTRLARRMLVAVVTVIAVMPWIHIVGRPLEIFPFGGVELTSHDRTVYIATHLRKHADAVVRDVNALAEPGERLFVGVEDLSRTVYNDTFFYYLLPTLEPATYFLEMNPSSADAPDSGLASDVASSDILILGSQYDDWDEPNSSLQHRSQAANRVVDEMFCLVTTHGPWSIHQRCEEPTVDG